MTTRYATAIAAILCATVFPAFAGPFYHLVGGICTDGSTDDNGQLLCNDNITATVEMADGYVSGTPFFDTPQHLPVTVAFFTFSDGVVTIATDFPLGASGPANFGVMPETSGQGSLHIHWFQGFFFDAESGTWQFGQELGPGVGQGYFSSGTYETWVRVIPEPGLLSLVGVALAMLALVRSRRSRVPIRA
jgi:hypothetical protein